MSTKRVAIEGDERLEGLLREGDGRGGVLVCHPHPLYGGSMHNNVVNAIEAGYSAEGFTTLRFNFRGVGASSGFYGEGEGETQDLIAAFEFLKGACSPGSHLVLAGYSFGAWIAARALNRLSHVSSVFLVALPVAAYGPGDLASFAGPIYLIAGTHDDIAFARDIEALYQELPSPEKYLKLIPTSHFFESREREIERFIQETAINRQGEGICES
ncbi:MAG TPA: alpha/beta hydrolase [Deltaproteobacteria bacterium]|nr:alpha/beta hydrolase [Deltaproteobacteria bacterium]